MLSQISLSNDPCCQFINSIPQWFFLVVHLAILVAAAVFAARSFGSGSRGFGWGFALLALAEASYLTYHVNLTLFLLAHTLSEVLVLLALLVFGSTLARQGAGAPARDTGRGRR